MEYKCIIINIFNSLISYSNLMEYKRIIISIFSSLINYFSSLINYLIKWNTNAYLIKLTSFSFW